MLAIFLKKSLASKKSNTLSNALTNNREVIDTTIFKFGRIDVLFSNHGIFPVKPIEEVSVEDIEKVLQVNFLGAVYLAKYGMEHVKKTKGSIAITSSMSGT